MLRYIGILPAKKTPLRQDMEQAKKEMILIHQFMEPGG